MAIQEVEVSNHGSSTTGFKREINQGAMGLILDTIQITQYTKPEESTVRELTANAVDSQREKEIAISILSGLTKPEDHFISRDGAKYTDSNWNASYYDLNHLDTEKSKIELVYTRREGAGYCDSFSVKDYGVGLGENRLKGYFQLGFSTKRNSKDSLGAFGFGNKVALSTRCDYYTMVSVHNGKRFRFNCYSYKIDSLVGKFNLETGMANDFITFDVEGTLHKIYFEATDEKNNTEIIVPTKRHHRHKYENAVKSQLLYFQNVSFVVIDEEGYKMDRSNFRANVLYNSEKIIVSDNSQFSRPHIIITKGEGDSSTGVCYGSIDFTEMEMEQLYGNVGVKCPIRSVIRNEETGEETVLQEGVEVTPSRESVVWSEHTRNFIITRFKEVAEEALEIVKEQLDEKDLLTWIKKVQEVKSKMDSGDNTVLRELSRVIDRSSLKPTYQDTILKYENPELFFFGYRVRYHILSYDHSKRKSVIKRFDVDKWDQFTPDAVYFKTTPTSFSKDRFLFDLHGSFVTIENVDNQDLIEEYTTNTAVYLNVLKKEFDSRIAKKQILDPILMASSKIKNYDDVAIPEKYEEALEEAEKQEEQAAMSAADKRKSLGQIPVHVMTINSTYYNAYSKDDKKPWVFKQEDMYLADLLDLTATVVYGGLEDADNLMLLGDLLSGTYNIKETSWHTRDSDNRTDQYNKPDFKIFRLNKANERHFTKKDNWKHVGDFFQTVTTNNE